MSKPLAAIIGCAMTEVRDRQEKSPLELAAQTFHEALKDSSLNKSDIDGFFITPEGFAAPNAMIWGPRLCEYLGLSPKSLSQIECGGASSQVSLKHAVNDIAAGNIDIAVVLAVDIHMPVEPLDQKIFLNMLIWTQTGLYGPHLALYGLFTPIPMYAMCVQRYMYEYGATAEEIAHLPVILRENASKNEYAQFRKPITVNDVLASRMVSLPIHQLECCPLSDGAAAIV
ncbi:MAG: thiolase family protein, partial [bacterium]